MLDWSTATFRKASRSHLEGQECVEVARLNDTVGIRDSKNPDGAVLEFGQATMTAFLDSVRHGGI